MMPCLRRGMLPVFIDVLLNNARHGGGGTLTVLWDEHLVCERVT